MVTISFEGSIALPIEDLDAVLGDAAQAVQNEIGLTGAVVVSADADHIDDGPEPDEISLDVLAECEEADTARWGAHPWERHGDYDG